MQLPNLVQRYQTAAQLYQRRVAAQQQAMSQQQRGPVGGLEAAGFVPNAAAMAGRMGGAPMQYGGAMPGVRPQQQGMGLQLPGMLGQQQPSINPFTGGGSNMQYRMG